MRVTVVLGCVALAACSQQQSAPAAAASGPPGIRYEAHLMAGGVAPKAGNLTNPNPGNAGAAKTGATLFTAMNCDGCHGGDASGWVGPSLVDGRWRYGGADEEVFTSIYFGRPKGMPAFGGVLSPTAIWSIVSYIKSLPAPATVPTESWEE